MRTFKNYLEAEKARREENSEKGFSLIELIVVVVILGILVAIAIPVFLNIQQSAKDNSLKAVAASAAAAVAADLASNTSVAALLADGDVLPTTVYITDGNAIVTIGGGRGLNDFCVLASPAGSTDGVPPGVAQAAGPGRSTALVCTGA